MRKRDNLWAWANHAFLNAGSALRCVYHITLPPQFDHTPTDVRLLAESNPVKEFLIGIGAKRRR